jgi:hypothetical protein
MMPYAAAIELVRRTGMAGIWPSRPNSADHTMLIRSGPTDVTVWIPAPWFRDTGASRHAIGAAVEDALSA